LGGTQTITPKYRIQASFEVEGVVEKSDVIGAIFGQTEGLFGPELDLHELQKNGRIGRIEIDMQTKQDKTTGTILVPTSLDKPISALTAAAIESVDRIGPCAANVTLVKIEDVRINKRESIIDRAQKILQSWVIETTPTMEQLTNQVAEIIKPTEIQSYGPEKLSAGPDVDASPSLIIVEGRADVANLLRIGQKNVIACEGTKIPDTIIKLSKKKEVTAFLDGDRGGDLILKGLMQVAKIAYVARAPRGSEVEDLAPKQLLQALNSKAPASAKDETPKRRTTRATRTTRARATRTTRTTRARAPRRKRSKIALPQSVIDITTKLKGTLEAVLLDEKHETMEQLPVSELASRLKDLEGVTTIVFDGVITQRLVDISGEKGIKLLVGDRISGVVKRPVNIQLLTVADLTEKK
jgi:DNA primase